MVSIGTEQRDHISYFGRDAVIVSENTETKTITIMLEDGTMLTVPKSLSIFNYKKIDNSERINRLQEQIDERAEDIKKQNEIWNTAKETYHKTIRDINGFFASLKITCASQITKKEDKEQYMAMVSDKTAARMTQIRADAAIQNDVILNLDDIYTKASYQNQEILFG